MATKKSDDEKTVKTAVTPAAPKEDETTFLLAEIEKLKAEKEAAEAELLELKAEKEEIPEEDEKVMVMIPFIPGQAPEETVWINGYPTQIKRGEQVLVSRPVASVLENSYEAQRIAMINREKLKNQRTDL